MPRKSKSKSKSARSSPASKYAVNASPAKRFFKGAPSKSRPGREDFETHKGDMYYNRGGHRERSRQGSKRKSQPFY